MPVDDGDGEHGGAPGPAESPMLVDEDGDALDEITTGSVAGERSSFLLLEVSPLNAPRRDSQPAHARRRRAALAKRRCRAEFGLAGGSRAVGWPSRCVRPVLGRSPSRLSSGTTLGYTRSQRRSDSGG